MKNLSIAGKILTVLGIFSVFVIVVAFYTTGQVRFINSEYTRLTNGPIKNSNDIAHGNAEIQGTDANIAQLMLDNTAARTPPDLASLVFCKIDLSNLRIRQPQLFQASIASELEAA